MKAQHACSCLKQERGGQPPSRSSTCLHVCALQSQGVSRVQSFLSERLMHPEGHLQHKPSDWTHENENRQARTRLRSNPHLWRAWRLQPAPGLPQLPDVSRAVRLRPLILP